MTEHHHESRSTWTRRTFLRSAGLAGAAAVVGARTGLAPLAVADPAAVQRVFSSAGTTLETVGVPGSSGAGLYRSLVAGPGWPLMVRSDLVDPRPNQNTRRTALASIVQTTDIHLVDSERPVRAEFLHPTNSSAFRSYETISTHGAVSLIERINAIAAGPFSGRTFDCVVSTGENTDNHEHAELGWFIRARSDRTSSRSE